MHWWHWWARRLKPRPKITAANFWDTDLKEIERQMLPKGVKITDLPIVMHIGGMKINKIKR